MSRPVQLAVIWTLTIAACGSSSSISARDANPNGESNACPALATVDAAITKLDDAMVAALCVQRTRGYLNGVIQWDTNCAGNIVLVSGDGGDCANYWLFDETTKELRAVAFGCNSGS